ncbi:hypothetical protein LDENG_00236780, partial [Lucifuga dentata]
MERPGCSAEPSQRRAADTAPSHSHIITPCKVTGSFKGGSLSSRNILQHNARNAAQAERLQTETDGERAALLRNQITGAVIAPREHQLDKPDDGRHKLNRMAAVHRREDEEVAESRAKVSKVTSHGNRDLHQMKPRGQHSKAAGIARMLSQAITTQHLLYASLGSAEYLEFVLTNPFNVPQTVTIHSDAAEL